MTEGGDRKQGIGTAALRITMGLMFLAHVGVRLAVITWPVALTFFRSLGLPDFMAYIVTAAEASVGILLVLGLYTRPAALAGAVVLFCATVLVHFANGFLFTNPGGGWEYPVFWTIALICQSLLGPGCCAVRMPGRRSA